LDEGSLVRSESHLRAARTATNFLEMSTGDVTTDARIGILSDHSILSAVLSLSVDVIHLDEDPLKGSESHLRAARTSANFWKHVRVV
jgi:hypothetical protein